MIVEHFEETRRTLTRHSFRLITFHPSQGRPPCLLSTVSQRFFALLLARFAPPRTQQRHSTFLTRGSEGVSRPRKCSRSVLLLGTEHLVRIATTTRSSTRAHRRLFQQFSRKQTGATVAIISQSIYVARDSPSEQSPHQRVSEVIAVPPDKIVSFRLCVSVKKILHARIIEVAHRSGPNSSLKPLMAEFSSADPPSKCPSSIDSLNFAPGASFGEESKTPPPLAKLYSRPNTSTPE